MAKLVRYFIVIVFISPQNLTSNCFIILTGSYISLITKNNPTSCKPMTSDLVKEILLTRNEDSTDFDFGRITVHYKCVGRQNGFLKGNIDRDYIILMRKGSRYVVFDFYWLLCSTKQCEVKVGKANSVQKPGPLNHQMVTYNCLLKMKI